MEGRIRKFKIGDRVRVIKEPVFVTMYPNDVWEMYPQDNEYNDFGNGLILKNMLGRANLQHLIGEEGIIDYYQGNMFEVHLPMEEKRGGWWNIKFDNNVAIPFGLEGFDDDEIELVTQ